MADQRGVPDLRLYRQSAESYYELHLEAIGEHDFNKRVTASWGLIANGSESLPYLVQMLSSRQAETREDASGCLAWLGEDDGAVVARLLEALEHEEEHTARDSIVLALGALRSRAALPALAQLVRSPDVDSDTRRCAVESLGRIVRRRFDKQPDPEAAALAWLDAHLP